MEMDPYKLVKIIERSLEFKQYNTAIEDAFNNVTTLTIRKALTERNIVFGH